MFVMCAGTTMRDVRSAVKTSKWFAYTLLVLLYYKKGAPQKRQPESCRSRIRAMVCRSVAMDQGLCRSARTGANPEGGIAKALRGRVSPLDRLERRGKNGSVRPPGTHRPQYREWRDGETRASLVLHSGPVPVLASVLGNHAQ